MSTPLLKKVDFFVNLLYFKGIEDDDMDLGVGIRIRNKRIELELTQEELAKRMGYKSKAAICKVERGDDNITTDRIRAFAKALECTPAYLMGWEDEEGLTTDMAQNLASLTKNHRLLHYATLLNNLDESQKDVIYNMIDALNSTHVSSPSQNQE